VNGELLDTNVISELIRPAPNRNVVAFLQGSQRFWLSVITIHELTFGAESARDPLRRRKLQAWLLQIRQKYASSILPVDASVAEMAGQLRVTAQTQGMSAQPMDALIGATAHIHGLTLVTRNTRDFAGLGIPLIDPFL
jgi:toxin FitB